MFFSSCEPKDSEEQNSGRDRRFKALKDEDKGREDRENSSFVNREAELRRLRSERSNFISSTLEDRYEGVGYGSYSGEDCEENESCKEICDDLISYKRRKSCYRSPEDLVKSIESALFELIRISDLDSVPISASLLAGIFDLYEDLLLYLVKKQMSEGDLRSFLAWVAVNEDIAEVFLNEDKSSDVLEEAFERLVEFQDDVSRNKRIETALNIGLVEDQDSFFYLSSIEDNAPAFEIAYDLLQSACGSKKDCKMEVLCSRENLSSRRSRTFGYQYTQNCRTLARQDRRLRSGGACYIHGAITWEFLAELIEEGDIRDSDFKEKTVTVDQCNDYCGDERNSQKCKRVL